MNTTSPGAVLESLAGVSASGALAAYAQASEASTGLLQAQRDEAQAGLPVLPAPTGLPAQGQRRAAREAVPGTPGAAAAGPQATPGTRTGEPLVGQLVPEAPPLPAPAPTELAGRDEPAREGESEGDPELARSAQDALSSVDANSHDVPTTATERPTVDMSGEANPEQLDSEYAASDQQTQQAGATAARAIQQDFGENAIYPEPDSELLRSSLSQGGAAAAGAGEASAPGLPGEALASIDAEASPILQERIGAEQQRYATAEDQYESDSEAAHEQADEDIAALEDEARATQTDAQATARSEVGQARRDWQGELDGVETEFQDKAGKAKQEQRGQIDLKAKEGNKQAGEHIAKAEQDAAAEKKRADSEAATKKAEAKKKSSGFWGWVKRKAKALIDGIKKAVNFIYDNLRKAVKAIFDAAKRLALAAIELARKAIVGLIQAFGAILKGLVSIALAAFPDIRDRMTRRIDQAVDTATEAVNKAADALKKGVAAVLDFLASTIDKLLGLIQDIYNGILTVVGMLISGELAELLEKVGNLIDAAKTAPGQFETAAYEELLGGNLDQPLSAAELIAAGRTPPGLEEGMAPDVAMPATAEAAEAGAEEPMPGPPWTEANVGVDSVAEGEELSPALTAELFARTGGADGEVTFGESTDEDRSLDAMLGSQGPAQGPAEGQGEAAPQALPDDGLTPRERAEIKWEAMKKGLAAWWSENWPYVLAGGVLAVAGFIVANILTGGAILAALPAIMSVVGSLFTGVMVVNLAGHVRDFLQKGWNGDLMGGGKSLAKALAAGAIELISLLTFKVGSVAVKGARAAAKGAVKGAQALARGTAKGAQAVVRGASGAMRVVRQGAGFVLRGGKVLLRGVGRGIARGAERLGDLATRLLSRTRFKGFRILLQGLRFRLEGRINPWVLLATGEVKWAKTRKSGGLGSVTHVDGHEALVISGPVRSETAIADLFRTAPEAADDMLALMRRTDIEPRAILQGLKELSPAEAQQLLRELRRFKEVDEAILREAINAYRARVGRVKVFGDRVEGGVVATARTEIHPSIDRPSTNPYVGASKHAGATNPNRRYGHPGRGNDWAKLLDDHAEQTILGDVANKLDEFRAGRLAREDIKGTIQMAVDQDVCAACRSGFGGGGAGIIKQFSDEFPNIRIIVSSMFTSSGAASKEILVIVGGKIIIKGAG